MTWTLESSVAASFIVQGYLLLAGGVRAAERAVLSAAGRRAIAADGAVLPAVVLPVALDHVLAVGPAAGAVVVVCQRARCNLEMSVPNAHC